MLEAGGLLDQHGLEDSRIVIITMSEGGHSIQDQEHVVKSATYPLAEPVAYLK